MRKRETISDLMYCRDAAGPNSELSYAFATATDLFDLDETSGIITTTSRLKYYTASSSSLEAIGGATDNRSGQNSNFFSLLFVKTH